MEISFERYLRQALRNAGFVGQNLLVPVLLIQEVALSQLTSENRRPISNSHSVAAVLLFHSSASRSPTHLRTLPLIHKNYRRHQQNVCTLSVTIQKSKKLQLYLPVTISSPTYLRQHALTASFQCRRIPLKLHLHTAMFMAVHATASALLEYWQEKRMI